jgi:hypothetical protein
VSSSIADAVNGVLPHLHARDLRFVFVSQAPLAKLQAYKRRMGWSFPWVSSARTDFNFDLGFSRTAEQSREAVALMMASELPPIVEHNARSTGTDIVGYLTESPGFSTFVTDDDAVYHAYATGRGNLTVRAKLHVETTKQGRGRVVIDEIPYQIQKNTITTRIVDPPPPPAGQESNADMLYDAGERIVAVNIGPGLSTTGFSCAGSSYVGVGITADPGTERIILVGDNTPASRAGLQHDDIVLNPEVWRDSHREGVVLEVTILREHVEMTVRVRVGRICIE